jgi:hypothetical protein
MLKPVSEPALADCQRRLLAMSAWQGVSLSAMLSRREQQALDALRTAFCWWTATGTS